MNAVFYTFSKRARSTARPSAGTTVGIILKEGCSVLHPSIALKYTGQNPSAWNYCYIADFGRYYYISDWTFDGRTWIASCDRDVLATYKTEIGSSSQYVTRAASQYDGTIVDQLYPTKTEPSYHPDSVALWSLPANKEDQTFIVTTAGRAGFMDYYLLNGDHLEELGQEVFSVTFYDSFDLGVITPEVLKAITDPEESVCAITYLPVKWSEVSGIGDAVTKFYLGYYEFTLNNSGEAMRHIRPSATLTKTVSLSITAHPDAATRGAYLNGDAFTNRSLYVPTLGSINLDCNVLQGCTSIEISLTLSLSSGMCNCIVYGISSGNPRRRLFVSETKVGVSYGFAARTIEAKDNMSAVTSAITSAATGDYVGAAAGIIGALQMNKPKLNVLGQSGSISAFSLGVLLEEVFYRPVDEDVADKGRPLCKVVQINTLSGYIKCEDATLSLSATDDELVEVLAMLNGGFFYE